MKRQHLALYAFALAILIVGLAFAGVPVTTLSLGLALLACPLMMVLMMGGMRGGADRPTSHSVEQDRGHHPATGRRA